MASQAQLERLSDKLLARGEKRGISEILDISNLDDLPIKTIENKVMKALKSKKGFYSGGQVKPKGMKNGGKVKPKGMKNGGKVKPKGMKNGGKVKPKGMRYGGKVKPKGMAKGGRVGGAQVSGSGFKGIF